MWNNKKEKEACKSLVESCFGYHNRNGRHISKIFEDLPDKNEPQNAAYYDKVPDPRSLRQVSNSLKKDSYDSINDFYTDLKLVFSNLSYVVNKSARDFQDAIKMDQYVDEAWEQKAAKGELPSIDTLFADESDQSKRDQSQVNSSSNVSEHAAQSVPGSATATPKSSALELPSSDVNNLESGPGPTNASKPTSTNSPSRAITTRSQSQQIAQQASRSNSAAKSGKRGRSESTSSDASGDGRTPRPASYTNGNSRATGSNKRPKKSTLSNSVAEEETSAQLKDRFPDSDTGWMRDNPNHDSQSLTQFILTRLKNERLPITSSLPNSTMPVEMLSDTTIAQDLPLLNLERIDARLKSNGYATSEAFDKDLHQAFLEAEKIYACDPDRLGPLYVLKRLYQELTQNDGSAALKDSIPIGTAKKLSSVTMGPGNKDHLPRNDEPVKLRAKDKVLLEGVQLKGDFFRVGDWVHLLNPDDPSRPIVAQIFNTYRRVDTGRRAINVCWYYRPEDTVHQISRLFIKDEIFKTGNFIDHTVEDILGRCLTLFYTKYMKGRPSPPLWTPTMPTYVCEHRYRDDVYQFKKIKNWDSCVPSNVRNEAIEESFVPFSTPQQTSNLVRLKSPFLKPPGQTLRASGEAIFQDPAEAANVLPKDQLKAHDFTMTLEDIVSIVGQLPDAPVRPPQVTENSSENGSNTPTVRSSRSLHKSANSASNLNTPSIINNNGLPLPPITAPSLPQSFINNMTMNGGVVTNSINSVIGGNPDLAFQSLKMIDFKSEKIREMLELKEIRRTPCLLDLVSNQEYFEELPEEIFSLMNKSRSDEVKDGFNGKEKDILWFPTPPIGVISFNKKFEEEKEKDNEKLDEDQKDKNINNDDDENDDQEDQEEKKKKKKNTDADDDANGGGGRKDKNDDSKVRKKIMGFDRPIIRHSDTYLKYLKEKSKKVL